MHFALLDRVLDHSKGRIHTLKTVTAAEEYLQDHFPTFPVLPGVLMLEACVAACRRLIELDAEAARVPIPPRYVLGAVRALKYGTFVAPGMALRIDASRLDPIDPAPTGPVTFKVAATVIDPSSPASDAPPTCVSGRITLRPLAPHPA